MTKKHDSKKVDALAMNAASLLCKFGYSNPDGNEWINLKDALMSIQGELGQAASQQVGAMCSIFVEAGRQ